MRRRLSNVLLAGTVMMAMPLLAQNAAAQKHTVDIAITYGATLSGVTSGNSFWMQGGDVQLHAAIARGFGVVADVAGMHTSEIRSLGVGMDMVTETFGPRFTWQPAHGKVALFGEGLVGESNGFHSVFPTDTGAINNSNSFAAKAGGGVNVALSPHIALRVIEADWLRTQFVNGTTDVQNNITLSTGLVFRFR